MKLVQIGMWSWGVVTLLLAFALLVVILLAASQIERGTTTPYVLAADTKGWLFGTFYVLKETGGLVGAVIGFSGLAWSHFFKASHEKDS